jgi:hypothetical protein
MKLGLSAKRTAAAAQVRRVGCGVLVAVVALVLAPAAGAAGARGWRVVPIALGSGSVRLSGVSCTAAHACTVVGDRAMGARDVGLAVRWNGSRWVVQSTPALRRIANFVFNAVACASARRCFAVGQYGYDKAGNSDAFVANWTGGGWTPGRLAGDAEYFADTTAKSVSCITADDCFAVGFDTFEDVAGSTPQGPQGTPSAGDENAEAWHWTGRGWYESQRVDPGIVPSEDDYFPSNYWSTSVSCNGSRFCMGVGGSGPSLDNQPVGVSVRDSDDLSLTTSGSLPGALTFNPQRWNDKNLGAVASNLPGTASTQINAVACGSPTSCEVVGDTNGLPPAFADGWNGKQWAAQTIPGAGASNIGAVSCPSSRRCVAVGTIGNRVLVDVWNGVTWAEQAAPTPAGAHLVDTAAVSCPASGACLLVGYYSNAAGVRVPFAERYS